MQLGIGAGLLVSAHSLHRQCQTGLVVARGGVGMSPGFLARKVNAKGELLRLSLFCCVPSMNDSLEVEVLYPA